MWNNFQILKSPDQCYFLYCLGYKYDDLINQRVISHFTELNFHEQNIIFRNKAKIIKETNLIFTDKNMFKLQQRNGKNIVKCRQVYTLILLHHCL